MFVSEGKNYSTELVLEGNDRGARRRRTVR
jgi:hypothetical protein